MIDVDFTINAVAFVTSMLAWVFMIFLAYRIYKKQTVKPKIWKILLVMFVGLFSFSINWTMFDEMVKFPILPLGVWILYFIFNRKEERWQMYRPFAWLGFWANFIFLASTLIAIPVHHVVYPKDEPTTYLSRVENSSMIHIHPSAKDLSLNKEILLQQLPTLKQETFFLDQWYEDTYMDTEPNDRNERFPYQLIGTSPKWGSGIDAIIYMEDDGKGLLISTPQKQLYFRSEKSFLEGVE
ncbi:hypothetical protein [Niallia sp. Krafla_26]|uniref:hypothetical protein n=1 Tax=Niallia sp. Krafla_26 TaxID=3064703 RepID=UPI003D16E4D7